jgi:putative ABC transport system permease protein
MVKEIRFALRRLVRSPAFTLIPIATLALAIDANTAVLSLIDALLIRPLPCSPVISQRSALHAPIQ